MNEQTHDDQSIERQPEEQTPGDQVPSAPPASKPSLTWEFAVGFLGWYLVMALVFWFSFGNTFNLSGEEGPVIINGLCVFPAQVLVLIFLFWNKELRRVGWGMLSAIGANLLISLILDLTGNAFCFIPFFAPLF